MAHSILGPIWIGRGKRSTKPTNWCLFWCRYTWRGINNQEAWHIDIMIVNSTISRSNRNKSSRRLKSQKERKVKIGLSRHQHASEAAPRHSSRKRAFKSRNEENDEQVQGAGNIVGDDEYFRRSRLTYIANETSRVRRAHQSISTITRREIVAPRRYESE